MHTMHNIGTITVFDKTIDPLNIMIQGLGGAIRGFIQINARIRLFFLEPGCECSSHILHDVWPGVYESATNHPGECGFSDRN
jgi:hypothetical protein